MSTVVNRSAMPNGADQAGTTDGYAAALESLRSTAKWLLAAFAGRVLSWLPAFSSAASAS